MPTIGIAGFAIGFRKSLSDKEYCVLDVMQFGNSKKPSEVIQIISYDRTINKWLNDNYNSGEIKAISTICYESAGKKGNMYSLEKIDFFDAVGKVGAISVQLPNPLIKKVKKEKDINILITGLLDKHYYGRKDIDDEKVVVSVDTPS